MFFWNQITIHCVSFKTSLQACHKKQYPKQSDKILNPKSKKCLTSERTLFPTPSEYQGSMCVEASLSFSFFLFFMVNIFSLIFLFVTYSEDLAKLQNQGKETAAYAYIQRELYDTNDKLIVLRNNHVVESPFPLLSAPTCRLLSKCVVKPWTGYDVAQGTGRTKEEQFVYMTEHGTVYHKDRGCSYLSLSIRAVSKSGVMQEKNKLGKGYSACELCEHQEFSTVVFVTSYGNRYHTGLTCKSLKRSIKTILLSEISSIPACSKCGD